MVGRLDRNVSPKAKVALVRCPLLLLSVALPDEQQLAFLHPSASVRHMNDVAYDVVSLTAEAAHDVTMQLVGACLSSRGVTTPTRLCNVFLVSCLHHCSMYASAARWSHLLARYISQSNCSIRFWTDSYVSMETCNDKHLSAVLVFVITKKVRLAITMNQKVTKRWIVLFWDTGLRGLGWHKVDGRKALAEIFQEL